MKKTFSGMFITLFAAMAVQAANQAPVISSLTYPNPVTGKTAALKVVATDDGGEANLTYTWSVTAPVAPVTFSPNRTNKAKNTTATYQQAGFYITTVTVKDKGSPVKTATRTVTVYVQTTLSKIDIWPPSITAPKTIIRKFTATGFDQFGKLIPDMPDFHPPVNWSASGGGRMYSNGEFLTGSTAGTWTITAKLQANTTIQATATIKVATPDLTLARQKIKNVFIIMQENRSFDDYFGTYPGANGFARIGFTSTHESGGDEKPDISHVHEDAIALLASSSYDPSGTYITPEAFRQHYNFADYNNHCFKYHNGGPTDLFNYWAMADTFVLQDFMFESCKSYSLPSHLYLVSGWSANCNNSPCKTELEPVGAPPLVDDQYKWTSIASLLNINDWKYYKGVYYNTNCTSCNAGCFNGSDGNVHYFWLPMSKFSDANNKADVDVSNLLSDLANNPSSVPKVCWIVPGNAVSEHMGQSNDVRKGQAYVTTIVKAIMSSSIWNNCAIFISWDDWGGHYDHAIPPFQSIQDNEGWGLRVPGLMLSPYAKKSGGTKKGWVDHEWYSHDAYLKLIEDLFCNSNRIGYGDGRPQQRESLQQLGDLLNEFDFNQTPRTNTTQFRNLMKCKTY